LVRDLIIASSAWQLHAPHNAPKENGDLVMSSVTEELAALLSTVRRPGDYFVSGTIAMLAPGLEVDGVGAVALPLLPVQAEQLIAIADRAPYGRGKETLVDTEVRRTWQIGADHVRLLGKHWAGTLKTILVRVADGLGITDPIEAELYKLLVYDKGSFFASHRDTEKVPGMFATLVVVLPSSSTGGELVVRHKGREERLDLRCDDPSEAAFAAFYADCVHEVLPVTEGYRLTLVYNLSRRGQGPAPEAPDYDRQQTNVAALLRRWATDAESQDDETPEKLIYPLEHAYTPAELGFETLKGVDAAAARVLVAAAPQAGCDLHLALASIEESGAAEYNPDLGSSRRRWIDPEDELEAGEVFDRHAVLSEWRRPDDSRPTLGELPVLDEELSPPDAFDDMAPDEEHFHEATGNEGASFERTYRRAALVLWPRERFFAVLNQAGLPATLSYLGELTERWVAAGEDSRSPLWQQAHELSRHMIPSWPTRPWYSARSTAPSDVTRMLTLLMQFEDMVRLDTFLSEVVACGIGTKGDNAAILDALRLLSPDRAKALTESIVAGAAATSLDTSADLLARAAAAQLDGQPAELAGAAAALIEALPGDPARAASGDPWRRAPEVQPGLLVDLFSALVQIDEALAMRAADHVLAWPKTYGIDRVLIPGMRELAGAATIKSSTAVQRLRTTCVEHLRARIAETLAPPGDWSRASELACKCPHCSALSRFLADPGLQTWTFKAVEFERNHVEDTIRNAHCDLDFTTLRRGRPYTLVCTKNQASYERRVKQRNKDLGDLERIVS
jgi:predicted 2-oxoglutarate/Fe(II)-dependent dioxygenase YbiX